MTKNHDKIVRRDKRIKRILKEEQQKYLKVSKNYPARGTRDLHFRSPILSGIEYNWKYKWIER